MDELDLEILDIIHILKRRLKRVNKLLKLLPYEQDLHYAKDSIKNCLDLYESMLLNKNAKRRFPSIKRAFGEVVYEVKFMYLRVLESKHNKKKKDTGDVRRTSRYFWPLHRTPQ
jgi:hypothetical protein